MESRRLVVLDNATDINDTRAASSNFGPLVDVHAPGVNITSAWHTSDTATSVIPSAYNRY